MSDNFKKPSYKRKQKLYVEKSLNSSDSSSQKKAKNNKNNTIKNYSSPNIPKNKKNKETFKKPFLSFLFTALLITVTATITYGSYTYFTKNDFQITDPNLDKSLDNPPSEPLQKNVNVLLIGLDKNSYHTDTMIVLNLNTVDGSIELISIPRDTYTVLPEAVVEEVRSEPNPIMPSSGVMKLTEVITYTQDTDKGLNILKDYVGELLNVKIDNYVAIDLESFSYLVDEIGGVYFDVPQKMYYNDNAQNLHIDLEPGYQLLDGDKAEQLIRFRKGSGGTKGYASGDLGRIEVQQAFLKAFIKQVMAKENIMGNVVSLGKTYYKYVTTDIGILDIPSYASYAFEANPDNITTYSLPVEYDYISGKSYAIPLDDEITTLSNKVFYDIIPVDDTPDSTSSSATQTSEKKENSSYTITILNGSGKKGFAGQTKEVLTSDGFVVTEIGDYTNEKSDVTRFFTSDPEIAKVFEGYFDSYEYVYTPNQQEDIIIVLGKDETLKNSN